MIDKRFIELLLQQLDREKAEKQALMDEMRSMRKVIALLRGEYYESNARQEALLEEFKSKIDRLTAIISEKDAEIARLNKVVEDMAKVNKELIIELKSPTI